MKKLFLFIGLLWAASVNAQFTPGQLLTASELNTQFALYSKLAGATFTGPVSGTTFAGAFNGPLNGSVGAITPSTGSFTNLSSNGTLTLPNGSVTLPYLATEAANTVVANFTGSTASPVAFSMPSCTGSSNALGYTSGTGIVCNGSINASTLGNATFASPPAAGYGSTTPEPVAATTITATSTITPSQTAGIVGTTTNNNANTGSVGEFQSSTTNGTSLTTATNTNTCSVSLTAGDWDVEVVNQFNPGTGATGTVFVSTVSTTSQSAAVFPQSSTLQGVSDTGTSNTTFLITPVVRFSLASTTTVYGVGLAVFSGGTFTVNGFIRARRVR